MAFKMKGSPHKMGTIKGSSSYTSALKMVSTPFHQEIATPSPDNYPMEGPTDFSEIKADPNGTLYIIASYEASGNPDLRFNLPEGFSDYTGPLGVGDRVDETALEELFGIDELSDEPVEINPPKEEETPMAPEEEGGF